MKNCDWRLGYSENFWSLTNHWLLIEVTDGRSIQSIYLTNSTLALKNFCYEIEKIGEIFALRVMRSSEVTGCWKSR
jgi:hypothetical protein